MTGPGTNVSVVVPASRPGPDFEARLTAVLAQRIEAGVEIVVAADGHQPELETSVAGRRADALRFVELPPSDGRPNVVYHLATQVATGEWIAYLGEADVWTSDHLATLLQACPDAGAGLAYARPVVARPDDTFRQPLVAPTAGGGAGALRWMVPGAVLHRAALLHEVGGWPVDAAADVHARLWQDMVDTGATAVLSPLPTSLTLVGRDWTAAARADMQLRLADAHELQALRSRLDAEAYEATAAEFVAAVATAAGADAERALAAEAARDQARDDLDELRATRWWRLHDQLVGKGALRGKVIRRTKEH